MRTLGTLRVSGEPSARTQGVEVLPTGEQLVHVRLVPRIEHERIVRGIEDAVEGDREFDDAEVRTEVATRARDVLDEEVADLLSELLELLR